MVKSKFADSVTDIIIWIRHLVLIENRYLQIIELCLLSIIIDGDSCVLNSFYVFLTYSLSYLV
jgi:hypothetical protein